MTAHFVVMQMATLAVLLASVIYGILEIRRLTLSTSEQR
jgi:hypothetical protein